MWCLNSPTATSDNRYQTPSCGPRAPTPRCMTASFGERHARKYGLGSDTKKSGLRWLYLPFMLLLGVGSMALATQRIAAFFSYHPALGEPWGVAWSIPWYAPWSVIAWQAKFGPSDTYGFIEQSITHSQALFLLPQFIVIGFWMAFMKKLRANANLHGSARWAKESESALWVTLRVRASMWAAGSRSTLERRFWRGGSGASLMRCSFTCATTGRNTFWCSRPRAPAKGWV